MNFGPQEMVIVLVIVIILFGAKRIPELGKSLGLGIKEFKKSTKALTEDDDEEKAKKSQPDTTA
jgi:sec-independent protein translocase protein TatA